MLPSNSYSWSSKGAAFTPLEISNSGLHYNDTFLRNKNSRYLKVRSGLRPPKGGLSLTGFTLVETLIVMTILSIVAAGIIASFVSGMKLWARANNSDIAYTNFLLSLETICRDLRQAVDIPTIRFEGSRNEISFPCLKDNSIVKVSYKFTLEGKSLSRGYAELKDILQNKGEDAYSEKDILSLDSLSFSYLYFDSEKKEYLYKDAWQTEDGIFAAVYLKAVVKGEEFRKIVFIPIACYPLPDRYS